MKDWALRIFIFTLSGFISACGMDGQVSYTGPGPQKVNVQKGLVSAVSAARAEETTNGYKVSHSLGHTVAESVQVQSGYKVYIGTQSTNSHE